MTSPSGSIRLTGASTAAESPRRALGGPDVGGADAERDRRAAARGRDAGPGSRRAAVVDGASVRRSRARRRGSCAASRSWRRRRRCAAVRRARPGRPCCTTRPASITAISSPIDSASSSSGVAKTMVVPSVRCSRLSSARMSWRSLASRLVSGSSSSRMRGWAISARPSASRCCSPPDSVPGLLFEPVSDAQHLGGLGDALADFGGGDAGLRERVGEVLRHGQVRVEREGLEHHRDAAAADRRVGDVDALDADRAGVGPHETADRAQRRGLADRGRPEQREEPALGHLEVHAVERHGGAVALGDAGELQMRGPVGSCGDEPGLGPAARFRGLQHRVGDPVGLERVGEGRRRGFAAGSSPFTKSATWWTKLCS